MLKNTYKLGPKLSLLETMFEASFWDDGVWGIKGIKEGHISIGVLIKVLTIGY